MTKLYETLALEGTLDAKQRKIVGEAEDTFKKRTAHFVETFRRVEMYREDQQHLNEDETKELVTTVREKLGYVADIVIPYLDTIYMKERGNQHAVADLVVHNQLIAKDVPATMLLGLESRLAALRVMYDAIPTLAPGRKWELDETDKRAGVYVDTRDDVRKRTQKMLVHKVLVEPTPQHPAQIEKWFEDVAVGDIVTTTKSGMIQPADKSKMLDRMDALIGAVKQARQRANAITVDKDVKIGAALFAYVHGAVI